MTLRAGVPVVAAVLVVLAGCGGSSSHGESAQAFMKRITTEFSRGQSERLWNDLVPSEQAVVGRSRYLACARNGFRLRSFKVLESYDEPVRVLSRQMPSRAVTVQVVSDDGVTTATMHAVSVGGRWRWVLAPADLAAYRAGRCL
jgi:hypothetical protein